MHFSSSIFETWSYWGKPSFSMMVYRSTPSIVRERAENGHITGQTPQYEHFTSSISTGAA